MRAIRDNLDSTEVSIDHTDVLGTGGFRITVRGKFLNGRRQGQTCACKRFLSSTTSSSSSSAMMEDMTTNESEMYAMDFAVMDQSIHYAKQWNDMCHSKDQIQFNRGMIVMPDGLTKFLCEPLIQPYFKYTSNHGWILKSDASKRTSVECLEAFCHYTYHTSDRAMIVCDLQGIYKINRFAFLSKSRYILSDPAISSARRSYGPSDMGQKGIETFFANHTCNRFCQLYGKGRWKRPRNPTCWFATTNDTNTGTSMGHTSMMSSSETYLLTTKNRTKFNAQLQAIPE